MEHSIFIEDGYEIAEQDVMIDEETRSNNKLWTAVLERATNDVISGRLINSESRRSALNWFHTNSWSRDDVGSLPFVCDVLGYSISKIKKRMKGVR